ncbi:MAG: hypothetical protein ABIJ09_26535 [Pseudomonadota bacterium]
MPSIRRSQALAGPSPLAPRLVLGLVWLLAAASDDLAPALQDLDVLDREAYLNLRAEASTARVREVLAAHPDSYDVAWRLARSTFKQAYSTSEAKQKMALGDEGYQASQRALKLRPDGVEALYWGTCAMGMYAQSAGVMRAIMDGVAGKIQDGFERAVRVDRRYNEAGPLEALGRYLYEVPWPLRDRQRALALFEEAARIAPHKLRVQAFLGDAYRALDRPTEARRAYQRCARAAIRREVEIDAPIWQAHCTRTLGEWTKGP